MVVTLSTRLFAQKFYQTAYRMNDMANVKYSGERKLRFSKVDGCEDVPYIFIENDSPNVVFTFGAMEHCSYRDFCWT